MTHTIGLLKPTAEHNTRRYDEESGRYVGEHFDRGERIIMVDGVRWGRTHVAYHGCNGTTHTFQQENGHVIEERPGERYPGEVSVRSMRRRGYFRDKTWRPTEELVLEKARELVEASRLKHPDVVKAANEQAIERFRARAAKAEAKRTAEFRRRACEALRINDETSEIVDRVVEAMEWAREQ